MKTTSHWLNLNKAGLEQFCLNIAGQSLLESKPDEKRTQYLMPDGRTTLQVRKVDDNSTYLDIKTTTLFQPAFVRKLIKTIYGNAPKCMSPSSSSSLNEPNLAYLFNQARETSYGEIVDRGYR